MSSIAVVLFDGLGKRRGDAFEGCGSMHIGVNCSEDVELLWTKFAKWELHVARFYGGLLIVSVCEIRRIIIIIIAVNLIRW